MPFQGPRGVLEGGSNPNHAGGTLDCQEAGRAASGSDEPELVDGASRLGGWWRACPPTPRPLVQFVCVESLVTALVDMYPRVFRKKNRREVLILGVSVTSFLVGLVMLTEVRVWGLAGGSWGGGEAKVGGSLSSWQGKQLL